MRNSALLLAAILGLGGCAANVKQSGGDSTALVAGNRAGPVVLNLGGSAGATASEDWARLKDAWRESMQSAAAAAGAEFSMQDGAPHATGQSGVLVAVHVESFRYVSTGARYGLGVMTGNATLDAKATFRDLKDGNVLGERSYSTRSSAWQGIFSAMTPKQVDTISRQIVDEVAGTRRSP